MKKQSEVINSMKICFDAISCNESFARQTVCAFASQLDPTLEELSDIRVIVSEAVTNAVVHAYKLSPGKIWISAESTSDRRLKVKIKDKGCGIEDIEMAVQPSFSTSS